MSSAGKNKKRYIRGFLLIIALVSFAFADAPAQTRKELENQKHKTQRDIEYTNKLLREVKASSKNSYNELLLLNRKIVLRQQLIADISNEIKHIAAKIDENAMVISSMEADLKRLRAEYAKMIYYAYKNRNSYDLLMFVLSSDDFNQAYKRLKYLQYYSQFRRKQSEIIVKTQEALRNKLDELRIKKEDRQKLINVQQEEAVILQLEKTEQSHVLNDLKSRESELKKQLADKQKTAEKIAKAIQKIIEEEAKKAAELAKKNRTPGEYALTPEDKLISDNFGNNKGRLPWPTERGEITSTFGEHEHPVLHGIKVRNNGVDISTQKGAIARAVFEGEVRQVLEIPGADKVVIIRHGSYLSVYQNLDNVFVSTGDKIKAKQSLGTIHTKGSDNTTTLQFQIWQESTKLDPALWLSR